MNPLKKLAGQTAIYGLSTIVGRLLNYLLLPVYTRVFLPGEFGVFTEIYAYVGFLMVLFTYGMETAYFRYSEKQKDYHVVFSTAFISILASTLIFTGILIAFSESIAQLIEYPQHPEYIIWFALILGFDALTAIPFARIRQKNQALKFAAIKLVNILVNIGLNLFFLVLCPWVVKNNADSAFTDFVNAIYQPEIGVGYVFIANLFASGLTFLITSTEIFNHQIKFDKKLLGQMLKYALPLLVVGFAGIVNEMIDRIMLRRLLPYSDEQNLALLGIYGACYKLSILITLFTQAFRYAAEPFFFSQSNSENAREIYAQIMNYFVIAGSFAFLAIMLYIDTAKYFIGTEYHSGLKVVPVLLMANLFLGIYYNLAIWYKLTDKTLIGAVISIGGALITILLNVLLIPVLGYMGSAWATLACYTTMVIASYLWGKKHYPVHYEISKLGLYILLAGGLYLINLKAVSIFEIENLVSKYLFNSTFLVVYCLTVYLIEIREKGSINKNE